MKIGLVSLGCPKNLVDSEVMLGLARDAGHTLTVEPADADVLVVNTCAFIDSAKQESIDAILDMAEHKKRGEGRRLIVTGCLAERYRDELRAEIPEIDAILGTGEVPEIVRAIDGAAGAAGAPLTFFKRPGAQEPPARSLPSYLYDADTPRVLATPRHYAYVKVAEGCDYKCAFCIIPTLRGHYRSRSADSIVREARALADRGVKELILISQNTTAYGRDLYGKPSLPALLHALAAVEGIAWIRFLYAYPADVRPDVIAAIADEPKVCKYLEMPLQHCNARVLKAMNRGGSRAELEKLITTLRRRIPGLTLRTTFIVGFPGETAAEFRELAAFVEWAHFERMGAFAYSQEEGTPAGGMAGQISTRVKEQRRHRLMERQRDLSWTYNQTLIGRRLIVLVDGFSDDEQMWEGRYEGQAPEIDGVVYIQGDKLRSGMFVPVEVTEVTEYDLIGRPVGIMQGSAE